MSHSGSHTPTNNPTISNINNPQSSASRAQILDDIPSAVLIIEDLARPPVTPPSLEPQIAESSSKRRTASESSTEKPMAKRIRRESPETQERASRHNSSSSDLQDESDGVEDKGKRPEPLTSTMTPPKKKRTRTLTTPQQFAVLQALLAKSRFPTTAMREDVGRSIGLSARKVQIWFQNQRQKARRPRSQSETPLTRPPQYGAFPNVPGPSSSRGFEEYPPARMSYTAQSTAPEVQPSPPETSARLLGPGMPGPAVYNTPHPYHPIAGPSTSAIPMESRFPGSHPPRRSESPRYYPSRSPRTPYHTSARHHPTSQPSHWHRQERDPLRTLPPLVPSSSYSTRRTHAPSSSLPSRLSYNPPYPISPESRFARHVSPEITSRPGITLPPPFAMHPSPHWNPTPHHPTPFRSEQRPIPSLWSRRDTRSTQAVERSIPTIASQLERIEEVSTADTLEAHQHPERAVSPSHSASSHSIPPSSSSLPPSRVGRYDPVRATFITRSTPTPTARSPAPQSGEDNNEEEINKDRNTPISISPKENH